MAFALFPMGPVECSSFPAVASSRLRCVTLFANLLAVSSRFARARKIGALGV